MNIFKRETCGFSISGLEFRLTKGFSSKYLNIKHQFDSCYPFLIKIIYTIIFLYV